MVTGGCLIEYDKYHSDLAKLGYWYWSYSRTRRVLNPEPPRSQRSSTDWRVSGVKEALRLAVLQHCGIAEFRNMACKDRKRGEEPEVLQD